MKSTKSEHLGDHLPKIPKPRHGSGMLTGLYSGYYELDELTGGLQGGHLYALLGRTDVGHQSFALNIASEVIRIENKPVLIVTLGECWKPLHREIVYSTARIWQKKSGAAAIDDDAGFRRVLEAAEALKVGERLLFEEQHFHSSTELRRCVSPLIRSKRVGLVLVRGLQKLLQSCWRPSNDTEEYSFASEGEYASANAALSQELKSMARELMVPVLGTIDLRKHSSIPWLDELAPYGYLESDADMVLVLHREDYFNRWTDRWGIADLYIAKNRFGPTTRIELAHMKGSMRFENLASTPTSARECSS